MQQQKTALPIIAGILILVSECGKLLTIIAGFLVSLLVASFFIPMVILPFVMLPVLALLVVAVLGGISALQRKRWGLALAGSIISALPFNILGVVALVLIAISRKEFD